MYSFYTVFAALVIGGIAGLILCALFSVSQVDSLQRQLYQKAEFWCKDCDVNKRLTVVREKLDGREAYIRTLEDRNATLTRSNRQLGIVVQKRSWGRV